MTKEDYTKAKHSILEEISNLNELKKKLEIEYIESNTVLKRGDKVTVFFPPRKHWATDKMSAEKTEMAYVSHLEISFGNVRPVLNKCKKDGSQSQIRFYYDDNCIISLHTGA